VSLTVVMPAHNEAALLEVSVGEVLGTLRARPHPFELIVVENGSQDATRAIAERLAHESAEVVVHSLPRADYGRALRTGLFAATGDVVVNFDVDYTDHGFLDAVLARFDEPDPPAIIIGSKRAPGAQDRRSWVRRGVTWAFALVLRVGFGLHRSDTHGMKALHREVVLPIARACRCDGELFDTELILRAERAGRPVEELPIMVAERRPSRSSITPRALRTLVGLVRLRVALRDTPRTR
jgi:glycosyltransferase involved in cell wall biosynthesis